LLNDAGPFSSPRAGLLSILIGLGVTLILVLLYVVTVLHTTADAKLRGGVRS
jgi:hypothetical protein